MTKILNTAVLGWFNFLNPRGDRIGEYLIKTLYPNKVNLLKIYNTHLLQTYDLLAFTAGNWHPRHLLSRNFKNWYRRIKIPYMVVELAIEKTTNRSCNENNEFFVENSSFVLVRDKESKLALGNSEKIKIGTDITWFGPLPFSENFNINLNMLLI